jgi:hypothetical protein
VWDASDIPLVQGTPVTVNLAQRATNPNGGPMTFRTVTSLDPQLEGAFHYEPETFLFSYDGRDLGLKEGDPPAIIPTGITIEARN